MNSRYLALASLPFLAACASIGSLLPQGRGAGAAQAHPAALAREVPEHEHRRLAEELARLRLQQADFTGNLARVQNPHDRAAHVRTINTLAERIERIESRLRAAGRPVS